MSDIFSLGIDDYTFPTTAQGMRKAGIFESPAIKKVDPVTLFTQQQDRSTAMSAALAWLDDSDYSYDAFDDCLLVAGNLDDIDDDDDDALDNYYNDLWDEAGGALIALGADADDVQTFIDGPNEKADAAGARIHKAINDSFGDNKAEDSAIIASYALGQDAIMESAAQYPQLQGVLEAYIKYKGADGKMKQRHKKVGAKIDHKKSVQMKKIMKDPSVRKKISKKMKIFAKKFRKPKQDS